MSNKLKINFSLLQKESKTTKKPEDKELTPVTANSELLNLIKRCEEDLMDLCRKISVERNCPMGSILPSLAIKQLAAKMPESKEEMLLIPHVTKANFEKFGQGFLDITLQYAAAKLIWMVDQEELANTHTHSNSNSNNTNSDVVDWSQYSQNDSQTPGGGYNRKRKFGGRQGSATKKFKRRRTSPKKKGRGTPKKKGGPAKKTSGFGLLPMPTFKK